MDDFEEHLVADVAALDEDAFVRRYPRPAIVVCDPSTTSAALSDGTLTGHFEVAQQGISGLPPPPQQARILPLVKRAPETRDARISVGRSPDADLVLAYPEISRVHAYFARAADADSYTLADAGSKNGTRVNGSHLTLGRQMTLSNGMHLTFGWRRVIYYMPGGLYEYLKASALGSSTG